VLNEPLHHLPVASGPCQASGTYVVYHGKQLVCIKHDCYMPVNASTDCTWGFMRCEIRPQLPPLLPLNTSGWSYIYPVGMCYAKRPELEQCLTRLVGVQGIQVGPYKLINDWEYAIIGHGISWTVRSVKRRINHMDEAASRRVLVRKRFHRFPSNREAHGLGQSWERVRCCRSLEIPTTMELVQ
jgi:hypothetical protein